MRLCVRFQAPTMRVVRRWNINVTTPPVPVMRAVLQLWAEKMENVVAGYPGCRISRAEPLVSTVPR